MVSNQDKFNLFNTTDNAPSASSNIIGYQERSFVYNTLSIPTVELKRIFRELSALFKRTQLSKSINIEYAKGSLYIKAATNVSYTASPIVLSSEKVEDFNVSIVFKDISEMLAADGVTKLLITNEFVRFETTGASYVFAVVDSINHVIPQIPRELKSSKIETKSLKDSLRILSKILPVAALYKKNVLYLFSNELLQVRLPAIWVETKNTGLSLTLSSELSSLLQEFIGDVAEVELFQNNSWSMIRKDLSAIYIPKTEVEDLKSIMEVMPDMNYIGDFEVKGASEKVQLLVRALGKSEVDVFACENGLRLDVRSDSAEVTYETSTNLGQNLDRFKVRLEFLNAVLATVGFSFKLYARGHYRCLVGSKVTILITSI